MSTCERATECNQPSTPSRPSPSGSGGTPSCCSVRSTKEMCSGGIIACRSTALPSVGIFMGITTSTPYGLPSVLSSSQSSVRSRSSASLNRTQPSTPRPPARETAAATCSDGVNAKIGYWIPNRSQSSVCIGDGSFDRTAVGGFGNALGGRIVRLPRGGARDLVDVRDGARQLVAGKL